MYIHIINLGSSNHNQFMISGLLFGVTFGVLGIITFAISAAFIITLVILVCLMKVKTPKGIKDSPLYEEVEHTVDHINVGKNTAYTSVSKHTSASL